MALRLPGDYNLKSLILTNDEKSVEISRLMIGLEIFEDIYTAGFTGMLHLNDGIDLYENFPIKGGEELEIYFASDFNGDILDTEFDFYKKLVVTGITDMQQSSNNRVKTYTIELASQIYLKNYETKLSRAYTGKVSEIVKDIYNKALNQKEELTLENTKHLETFVVPNWAPIRTINYLSKHAVADTGTDTSFLFFETKDGFTFSSLGNLIKKKSTRTLTMESRRTSKKILYSNPNVITTLEVKSTPDIIDGIVSGMYGGTQHVVDIEKKSITSRSFEYDTAFKKSASNLNTNQLPSWPNNQGYFKHHLISGNLMGVNAQSFRLERISRINQINAFVVMVKCPNYTAQKVGDVVTLEINSAVELIESQGKEIPDKTLSGNYLVRNIRHLISQTSYDIIMELAKETI